MRKIKCVVKRPDEEYGHMTNISDSLENLQKTVGGYIEPIRYGNLVIIVNEEGKLRGLDLNLPFGDDWLVGDIIVCGVNGEEFDDIPISFAEWKDTVNHLKREAGAL